MDHSNLLGTAQIPREHWKAARLVGSTPFIASRYDQRSSYCMYIPESHYQLPTSQSPSRKLPLIVNIHGSLRRAERARDSLISLADETGAAIIAPLFPAGIEDPNDTHNYKFLRYKDIRYDLILLSMIDEVAIRWPGIETGKLYLTGYSGGGQFVSRFFLLHPERLKGVSIGAPGVVTRLDTSLRWPKGLGDVEEYFDGQSVDAGALKSVKHVQLVVGGDDTKPPGDRILKWISEQKQSERRGDAEMLKIPPSLPIRMEALAQLRDELTAMDVNVRYDVVEGVGHDFQGVFPAVEKFLRDTMSIANGH